MFSKQIITLCVSVCNDVQSIFNATLLNSTLFVDFLNRKSSSVNLCVFVAAHPVSVKDLISCLIQIMAMDTFSKFYSPLICNNALSSILISVIEVVRV